MYIPDVWNCMWTKNEWETFMSDHKAALEKRLGGDEQQVTFYMLYDIVQWCVVLLTLVSNLLKLIL